MTLNELDFYFNSFLKKEDFQKDPSMNGIQISNHAPNEKQIECVAFAVDACAETAEKAVAAGAQLLFVHHGLFWGDCTPLTGIHYNRIAAFIENDLALFASHIPLDSNHLVGNNYGLADKLQLVNLKPFGEWRGMTIGVTGTFRQQQSLTDIADIICDGNSTQCRIFPFGNKIIKTAAIISGGAGDDFEQAVAINADVYITGEISHEIYHHIKENKINVIAAGHYQTETTGVKLVQKKLETDMHIRTVFLDVPTGL
jgi:dinuclear metal center YbgI/SA1388 family protein